jgi:hypothetical protein
MREFAFEDPEGWVITIAEEIKQAVLPKNSPGTQGGEPHVPGAFTYEAIG